MSHDLVGRTLGEKYRLERLIGQGGMGAVYEARHVDLNRRFAVKILTASLRNHPEVHARFRREARATSAVQSENIVQVVDVSSEPDVGLYMVMELLAGEDLESRLRREKRLAPATVVAIAKQILRGLAKAHMAGVVHRDLKPANIFLVTKDDGSTLVKIVDFGISKLSESAPGSSAASGTAITRIGNVIGTAQYMSPEQAQGLASLDHRTDIWSLGALLYECLAGVAPFPEGATYEITIVRIVTSRAIALRSVAPWVPLPLASAVDKALSPHADDRHRDCAAFLSAIDEEASTERESALPPPESNSGPLWSREDVYAATQSLETRGRTELVSVSPVPSTGLRPEKDRRPRFDRARVTTAIAIGSLTALGAAAWFARRSPEPEAKRTPSTNELPLASTAPSTTTLVSPGHQVPPAPTLQPLGELDRALLLPEAGPHESRTSAPTKPVGATKSPAEPAHKTNAPPTASSQAPRPFGGAGLTNAY